ncbi:hypothetical protein [Kitasatospora fiedleri]|uniref:hypothetical protein n=1 Tax=Kitasatospora fiedleri TaxID=2991545 RepID=UPI00249A1805|nr:hypothetical protein [Kitasatospora fiedleri]
MLRSALRRTALPAVLLTAALAATACGSSTAPAATGASAAAPVTVAGVSITPDQALHDALPDAVKKSGKVRVATDVPYPRSRCTSPRAARR